MDTLIKEKKPILSLDGQIDKMKEKGITFCYISQDDAKRYLNDNNYYFKLTSFRKNYHKKKIDGKDMYIDLDFAYLQDLAIIDMELRYLLVHLSLDIEHYTKLYLLNLIEEHDEDGYKIIREYFDSLSTNQCERLKKEILRNSESVYCQDLISHNPNPEDFPIWVFLELISFGTLVAFYGFCGNRYNDKKMIRKHFILKMCKSVRNATAHSNCIINNLKPHTTNYPSSYFVLMELSKIKEISKTTRDKKMSNSRMQQIISLLYMHRDLVQSEGTKKYAARSLHKLTERINRNKCYYQKNDLIRTNFEFLIKIIDNWYPIV